MTGFHPGLNTRNFYLPPQTDDQILAADRDYYRAEADRIVDQLRVCSASVQFRCWNEEEMTRIKELIPAHLQPRVGWIWNVFRTAPPCG